MLLLKPKHLSDLPITQRRFPLAHLARNRRVWLRLFQKLFRRCSRRDVVVRSIEYLEAQSGFLDTQITDLTQISGVDVGPGVALSRFGLAYVCRKVLLILMRLDHVSDPKSVDVVAESAGKGSCCALATEFAQSVTVHGVNVVIFFQGKGVVIGIALGEADAVGGFGTGDENLLDPELGCGFDDVVGRSHIGSEALVVWYQHVAGVGGEVDHDIWGTWDVSIFVT